MKNKMAYLGFLGFLGLFGLWAGATVFLPFLLCFFFFTYANMERDELFRHNLRRAGLYAAVVNLGLQALILVYAVWRNMTQAPAGMGMDMAAYETLVLRAYAGEAVTLPGFFFLSLHLQYVYFIITFMLSLCVFMFSLLYFSKREKRAVEE